MKDKCKMVNCRNALHNSKRKINLNAFSRKWDSPSPALCKCSTLQYVCIHFFSDFYPFVSNTKVLFKLNNGSVFYTVIAMCWKWRIFLTKENVNQEHSPKTYLTILKVICYKNLRYYVTVCAPANLGGFRVVHKQLCWFTV